MWLPFLFGVGLVTLEPGPGPAEGGFDARYYDAGLVISHFLWGCFSFGRTRQILPVLNKVLVPVPEVLLCLLYTGWAFVYIP